VICLYYITVPIVDIPRT
jgi:hypothetical protein